MPAASSTTGLRLRALTPALAIFVVAALSSIPSNAAEPEAAALTVVDENGKSHGVSISDLAKLPRHTVTVADRDGVEQHYEGCYIGDVLSSAGVELGEPLRGDRLLLYATVEAADDYRVVFALAELDPARTKSPVLLADRCNGRTLSEKEGPLRLVAPAEEPRTRWVRQVQRVVIRSAKQ